jgi:Fe-S-cluster-containing hydrogenase component 2
VTEKATAKVSLTVAVSVSLPFRLTLPAMRISTISLLPTGECRQALASRTLLREFRRSRRKVINKTGVATAEDLAKVMPSQERLEQVPCVIIECFERIPCNPCVDGCPQGAIKIEGNINNLPEVDYEKCTGCGICVSSCPGLAIFVVDRNYSKRKSDTEQQERTGLVMLPYEFLPLPERGEIVDGLSREGKKLCDATVVRVLNSKKQDRTSIISVVVPEELIMEIRNIRSRNS